MILIKSEDYVISAEILWFGWIMHGTVSRWNKTVKQQIRNDLRLIAASIGLPLYAFQTKTHDPLKRKFIKEMGFVFDHYRWTTEGERSEMYRLHPLAIPNGANELWEVSSNLKPKQSNQKTRLSRTLGNLNRNTFLADSTRRKMRSLPHLAHLVV